MTIRSVNIHTATGQPVQKRILTVAELAAQLQDMILRGQGDLPVFTSDGRGSFLFETVVPYTPAGYPDCLLIKPQAHLHAEVRDFPRHSTDYFERINAEADRIREVCGAFHA